MMKMMSVCLSAVAFGVCVLPSPQAYGDVSPVGTVRTSAVGDVRVVCEKPGDWTFGLSVGSSAGSDVVTIRLSSSAEVPPPNFKVKFEYDAPGTEHVWLSDCDKVYGLWPGGWRHKWLSESSLAHETPVAVAFDNDEKSTLAVSADEVFEKIVYAIYVNETTEAIGGEFEFFSDYASPRTSYEVQLRFDSRRRFWADAVREASDWIVKAKGFAISEPPESAFEPLYSSWYSFLQDVEAKPLEREAELAASLGMKAMILDDGWQKVESVGYYSATGDWMPVKSRFPDMKAHVEKVHRAGLKYLLWLAVPYVGDETAAWDRFKDKMLFVEGGSSPGRTGVLDPRFPDVREYLIQTYERAVRDWGFDGLKLDFIDRFADTRRYSEVRGDYGVRDYKSVVEATDRLMRDVRVRLAAIKPDVLIEFRQHYMGPAILQYGNMIRANDCQMDPWSNRKRICDLRLTSGPLAVHSDMLVWSPSETPEGAAIPILNALFSTIQFSVRLKDASEEHRKVIRHWIDFARKHRETLLKGRFRPRYPQNYYPVIEAEGEGEEITAVYNPLCVVAVEGTKPEYVVNATAAGSLVLELSHPADYMTFDVFGRSVRTGRFSAGLVRASVPQSGYVRLMTNWR